MMELALKKIILFDMSAKGISIVWFENTLIARSNLAIISTGSIEVITPLTSPCILEPGLHSWCLLVQSHIPTVYQIIALFEYTCISQHTKFFF